MSEFDVIVSGFLRIIQVSLYISLIIAGIALVVVGGYSVVRGHGARWSEMIFAIITLVLVAFGISQYPAILIRSVNEALETSRPEMLRLTGNIDQLIEFGQTGFIPVITPTVTIPLPPTPAPAETIPATLPPTAVPTATPTALPNILQPAVTTAAQPTIDPALWNPMTPPPTRSTQ